MSNMSYVRFENTLPDLEDCLEHLEDPCSESEHKHRKRLIEICSYIVATLTGEDPPYKLEAIADRLPVRDDWDTQRGQRYLGE